MVVLTIITEEATPGDRVEEGKPGECDVVPRSPREEGVHEG